MDALIEDLKSQRDAIVAELATIAAKEAKVRAAASAETEASAAIRDLNDAELAATSAWLAAGATGTVPAPDMQARAALTQNLAAATIAAATMRAAGATVAAEHALAAKRLAAVEDQISAAAIDAIAQKYTAQLADAVTNAVAIQESLAQTVGALEFLKERGNSHQAAGEYDKATAIFATLEALAKLPKPEFMPTTLAARAAVPAWRDQFQEAIK
jgi:hypothetical protein